MACGTGKTFTSLKIAESFGRGSTIAFFVPSLALLSQALREWTGGSSIDIQSFAVCSDSEVGKSKKENDEKIETFTHELAYPATTNSKNLANEFLKSYDKNKLNVIFSTYHSIEVMIQAQKKYNLPEFDLILCDEAHRTTGATFESIDESNFVKVHKQEYIQGKKRLYMTATPRIYTDVAKISAIKDKIELCSMDDEELYGKEFYILNFSESVRQGLLVDYKVVVLAIDEAHVSRRLQKLLADENNQIKVDDASKIIGCWKALSKMGSYEEEEREKENVQKNFNAILERAGMETEENYKKDLSYMKRAVAFCQVIEYKKENTKHKVSSKLIAENFSQIIEEYKKTYVEENPKIKYESLLSCEADHVDGTMGAIEKNKKLNWLKEDTNKNTCRILSNVRCLSEGVDVPALDAVIFLTPRQSQMDVVQSVGRVMRLAPNKKLGYVILPVVIPSNLEAHQALENNENYKVVWQVLQALRSHDDRFDAMINKMDLREGHIPDKNKMEVVCVSDEIPIKTQGLKSTDSPTNYLRNSSNISDMDTLSDTISKHKENENKQQILKFEIGEIERAIYAKIVKKCGNRMYWEEWAGDIAKIASTHITRIQTIIQDKKNVKEKEAFENFAKELRDDLNEGITNEEVVEMLAQHLITRPVFDALFSDYEFSKLNPVSLAMDKVLKVLEGHHIEKEADVLHKFYESVKFRASNIHDAKAKQKIILELYDKFFRNAFPKMTERLGIVYTPVEVVDFILHSVDELLQSEFGESFESENVQILDPFVGTGTFITRLIQSGLISKERLPQKYKQIHANEIVLLAYYIAAINIESVYHSLLNAKSGAVDENGGGENEYEYGDSDSDNNAKTKNKKAYTPFEGICLTDTFELHERKNDFGNKMLRDNSSRRSRQKQLDIRVIVCNPPYSSGQRNANDNNQNQKYPSLDERIAETYVRYSTSTNKNSLYDSYIRAIRWASDRIGDRGVVGIVTNASYIDSNAMNGLRKCLQEEYSSIYIFHLRGNQRTAGELSRREGGKIFGGGSRAPIALSLLVKNPKSNSASIGEIFLHDIGDYLSREEKLDIVRNFKSLNGITHAKGWQKINPDKHHDWLEQRDDSYNKFISIGNKKEKGSLSIFENYSRGIGTSRDAWVYNFSKKTLEKNIRSTINFYNSEVERWEKSKKNVSIEKFVIYDNKKFVWVSKSREDIKKNIKYKYSDKVITKGVYRPFTKQFVYFHKNLIYETAQMPRLFPDAATKNLVICVNSEGPKGFNDSIALMTNALPDLHILGTSQCFPPLSL